MELLVNESERVHRARLYEARLTGHHLDAMLHKHNIIETTMSL